MWLLLKNGRVIDPSQGIDQVGDLLIVDGRIAGIGKPAPSGEGETMDCSGTGDRAGADRYARPSARAGIRAQGDHCDRARGPRRRVGSRRILAMPNTKPAVDNRAVVEYVLNEGKSR